LIGFSKGGFGGLGGVLTPLLSLLMPPAAATGVLLPMLIFADWFAVASYWREWDRRLLWAMLPAAAIGSLLGTWVLTALSADAMRLVLAGFIIFLLVYKVAGDRIAGLRYRSAGWHGPLAGGLAGLFSGMFNNGGPTFNAYLLLQKIQPRPFIATGALFFALLNLIKVPFFVYAGVLDLPRSLIYWPAFVMVPLGIWAARRLITRIKPEAFEWLVIGFLIFSACVLIWQTL
jgi:uncharacterized membrane protein YfcA